jgi:predicted nucleic acid-binding protein
MSHLCKVFIDTSPIIYHIEENQQYAKHTELLFNLMDDEKVSMVVSATVLSECLVIPLRNQDYKLVANYLELFQTTTVDINFEIAIEAAKLRADNQFLKYPDASNLAVAMYSKCDYFITNDQALLKVQGLNNLKVILIQDVEQHLNSIVYN